MTSLSARKAGVITALAAGFLIASLQVQLAQQPGQQPGPGAAAAGQRGGRGAIDPRVQQRTYLFPDTNEQLPYAVFVSSKVSKDKKNPLIVALHGLGGDQNTMMRGNALIWRYAGSAGLHYRFLPPSWLGFRGAQSAPAFPDWDPAEHGLLAHFLAGISRSTVCSRISWLGSPGAYSAPALPSWDLAEHSLLPHSLTRISRSAVSSRTS